MKDEKNTPITNIAENQDIKPEKKKRNLKKPILIIACIAIAVILIIIMIISFIDAGTWSKSSSYNSSLEKTYEEDNLDGAMTVMSMEYTPESYDYDEIAEETASAGAIQPQNNNNITSGKEAKIIYSADIGIQTKEFEKSVSELENLTEQYNGYFENSNIFGNTGTYRTAYFLIRIPQEYLDAFLDSTGNTGTVTSISRNAQDVSYDYYDTDSRLTTAKKKLERLQSLLEEAENMEDIITLETAISDVEWEIDNYRGSLRYYDSKIDYSTVSVDLREVYEIDNSNAPVTFNDKVGSSFHDGLNGFVAFLEGAVFFLAAYWIWLLIITAVVVAVIVIVTRKGKKKSEQE